MMRKLVPLAVLVAAMVSALALVATAEAIPLEQVALDAGQIYPAYLQTRWTTEKPDGVGPLPEIKGAKLHFSHLKLGDSEPMLMAFDMPKPKPIAQRAVYSVQQLMEATDVGLLYLDTDRDGNLLEEVPLEFTESLRKGMPYRASAPVTLPVLYELANGEQVTRDVEFRLATYPRSSSTPVLYMAATKAWQGVLKLGDDEVAVRLADGDGDAAFTSGTMRDTLSVDNSRNGKLDAIERLPLCKYVEIRGDYYTVDVRKDGGQLTVEPYGGQLGKLLLSAQNGNGDPLQVVSASVRGQNLYCLKRGHVGVLTLPPGQYRLNYELGKVDAQASYSFTVEKPITIVGGENLEMQGGGELGVDMTVSQTAASGNATIFNTTFSVSLSPHAAATGHKFRGPNGPDGVAGKVEVLNSAGKVVASGKATYG